MSALAQSTSHLSAGSASIAPSYHSTQDHYATSLEAPLSDGDASDHVNPPDGALDAPPAYSPSTVFTPTVFFQVETQGKKVFSLPTPPAPVPIHIYGVTQDGLISETKFVSLRAKRSSGSCTLVDGNDESQVRSKTTYRFGPGRDPKVKLLPPPILAGSNDMIEMDMGEDSDSDGAASAPGWDDFELKGRGLLTRAIIFKTRLGTFEWRYATRHERKAAGADSLLVLDRIAKVALAQNQASSSSSKDEEVRTPVAHFVRNEAFRTAGTSRAAAGNGGRLMVDLSLWDERLKVEREMAVVFMVTTCVTMLKKEVDRRRTHQIMAMSAAASGGP